MCRIRLNPQQQCKPCSPSRVCCSYSSHSSILIGADQFERLATQYQERKKKKICLFPFNPSLTTFGIWPSEVNGPRPYFLILSKGVCLCIDAHIGHEQTNEGPSVSSGLLCKDPAQRPGVPFRELWVSAAMVRQAEKITGLGVTEPGVEYWPRRFLTM